MAKLKERRREYTLRNCLSSIRDDYDYILLDCQPSLGMLTINALASANSVIIPVQSEYFALRGMTDLFKIINKVRRQINPILKIEEALLTLVDPTSNQTDMWSAYEWSKSSQFNYFKAE